MPKILSIACIALTLVSATSCSPIFAQTQSGDSGADTSSSDWDALWTPPVHRTGKYFAYEQETDADWVDDRFNSMDVGKFLTASIRLPSGEMVAKAFALQISREHHLNSLFDKERMLMRAGWTGQFLDMSSRRFGLLEMPTIAGSVVWSLDEHASWKKDGDPLRREQLEYQGLTKLNKRDGTSDLLSYLVDGIPVRETVHATNQDGLAWNRELEIQAHSAALALPLMTQATDAQSPTVSVRCSLAGVEFSTTVANSGRETLWLELPATLETTRLTIRIGTERQAINAQPAPSVTIAGMSSFDDFLSNESQLEWGSPIPTSIETGEKSNDAYVVDNVRLPFENPFNALLYLSGIDFSSDGSCYVSAAHGDVWKVTGLDATNADEEIHFQRYATGLYQPLGLRIVDDRILVLGRDQITELVDRDGNGEADWYGCFNDDLQVLGQPHAYAMCLESDDAGNLYFLKSGAYSTDHGGTCLKVSADGKDLSVLATGYRHPNGLGVSPEGFVTSADNEGNWTPATRLDKVEAGEFNGHMPNHHRAVEPTSYDEPMCWLPRSFDNSAGGQLWTKDARWGPLGNSLLHLSFGHCTLNLVMPQKAGDVWQAAALRFPNIKFRSGSMRARINPADGQLYVVGLDGWQTAAIADGCLQRVRYTGNSWTQPVAMHVKDGAIELRFVEPLDPVFCQQIDRYQIEQWQYRWTADYGSAEYKISDPNVEGHDRLEIDAVQISDDGLTLTLAVPQLTPVMQMRIQAGIKSASGVPISIDVYNTIHALAN